MSNRSRFVIRNDLPEPATLNIEPEGHFVPLGSGEEVSVVDDSTADSATVRLSKSDGGALVISIWPGDGEVKVERRGVDVLEEGTSDEPSGPRRGPRVPKPAASS